MGKSTPKSKEPPVDEETEEETVASVSLEDLIEATLNGVMRAREARQTPLAARSTGGGLKPPKPSDFDWPWNIIFGLIWGQPGDIIPLDGGGGQGSGSGGPIV